MTKRQPARRSRGRPLAAGRRVGPETIVAAARRLLETGFPARITATLVAREAGVDRKLVGYYFGSREALLLAAVEDLITTRRNSPGAGEGPADARLAGRIKGIAEMATRHRFMQRVMIEDLVEAKSSEIREKVRELNANGVDALRKLLESEGPGSLTPVNPLFLQVAIIGMAEFFSAAQPMIQQLVPEGTDREALAAEYRDFLVTLVLDGVRPRQPPEAVD